MVAHCMQTLCKATGEDYLIEATVPPVTRACRPHFTEVKSGTERAGDEGQPHGS